jgi:hypothetical protein
MRYFILLSVLLLVGCVSSPEAESGTKKERKASVIYVGMLLADAEIKLKEYGAKPYEDESLMLMKYVRQGYDCQKYHLLNGPSLQVVSKSSEVGRKVYSILVSTYVAKSWESKSDPEVLKFQASYESRKEIDLEGQPNKPLLPTPGKSPVSNHSQVPGAADL